MPPPSEVPRKKARKAAVQDLSTLTVKELREVCKERGVPCHGAKALILERLQAEQQAETPASSSPVGLPLPPTRSPLRGADSFMEAVEASQASAASAVTTVLTSFTKKLTAMPREKLRSACDARGLATHGTQQQLVGRLAALLVPADGMEGASQASTYEEVPASSDTLSLPGLQAACRECGLPHNGTASELAERLATHVAEEETHEVPADDPVSEELDDPVASFAPTVKDTLGGKVAMPVPTMPEDMVSPRRPQRHLKERKVLEASPADSIPAAQPDFMSSASQDAKAEDVAPSQGTLVPVPAVPTVPSVPTVQKEVPEVEMEEMPAMSQHLDDGFRAGLRLLHTEELRRACLERGLDFQGSKGDLLNRLLGHFARAPPPTPTQDLGVACGRRRTQETKETVLPPMENLKVNKDIRMADQQERPETGEHKYHKSEKKGKTEKAEKTKTVKTVELKSKDSDSKAPKASHIEIPKEIQQLRPLEPTVKAPVLRTLLSRPRSTVQAAAPNFTALWRTMCPEVQKQTSTADAGVGLSVAPPGRSKPRGRSVTRRPRGPRIGTCHARTVAGGPCRNAGRLRPDGARYVYCARHSQRWARYETVGVEDLKPMPKEIPKEIPREIKKPKVSKSRARIASQDGPEARTSRPIPTPARADSKPKPLPPKPKLPSPAKPTVLTRRKDRQDRPRESPKTSQKTQSPKAEGVKRVKRTQEVLELPGLAKVMALLPQPKRPCKRLQLPCGVLPKMHPVIEFEWVPSWLLEQADSKRLWQVSFLQQEATLCQREEENARLNEQLTVLQASKQLRDLSATHTGKEDTPDVLEEEAKPLKCDFGCQTVSPLGGMAWHANPAIEKLLEDLTKVTSQQGSSLQPADLDKLQVEVDKVVNHWRKEFFGKRRDARITRSLSQSQSRLMSEVPSPATAFPAAPPAGAPAAPTMLEADVVAQTPSLGTIKPS
eukprot:symbB.v1.2.011459.t1/scaffold713.1/size170176/8